MLTTVCSSLPALQLAEKRVLLLWSDEAEIQVRAASGWAQNWVFWGDGVFTAVYAVGETDLVRVALELNPTWETHLIYAFPIGQWEQLPSDAALDLVRNTVEASLGVAIDAEWPAPIEIRDANDDGDQFVSWALTGLERFTNCNRVDGIPTQARLEILLTTVGGVHTLTLSAGNQVVASGSRSGNGSITLAAQNGSGISGSVSLTYSADLVATDEAYVLLAWPKEYTLAESAVTLATIQDNGYGNRFAAHIDLDAQGIPLASGAHAIALQIKSDTNQESAFGTPVSITLTYRTPSPSAPEYIDGDYTNTRIRFVSATPAWTQETAYGVRQWVTPSSGPAGYAYECTQAGTSDADDEPTWPTTLGATVTDGTVIWTCRPAVTYCIYDSGIDGAIDYAATPIAAVASGGLVTVALAALGAAAAGTRRIAIVAVCAGLEDLQGLTLELTYDAAGAIDPPGPNAPNFLIYSILGRVLTLSYEYDPGLDSIDPVTVQAWLVAEGATPNWSSPDVSQAIADADDQGRRVGTVALPAAADGHWRWIVRTVDVAGGRSMNTELLGPRWLGTSLPDVPTLELLPSA